MSKVRRLKRFFSEEGKSIILALDHYYFTDNTIGLDETIKLIPELSELGLNGVIVTKGMANMYEKELSSVGIFLRMDISNEIFNGNFESVSRIIQVEEAVKLGAEGIVCMTFPGSKNEIQYHKLASQLAYEASKWNLVLMLETLPYNYKGTSKEANDYRNIATAGRLGVEIGADVIKTRLTYTENDNEIIKKVKKPVLALGGPKTDDRKEFFSYVKHCMDIGASGVAVGRNVWKDENPKGMLAVLNDIVHKGNSVEEALKYYEE